MACWCRMGQACHADLLLEIANGNHELLGNMMASTAGSGDAGLAKPRNGARMGS